MNIPFLLPTLLFLLCVTKMGGTAHAQAPFRIEPDIQERSDVASFSAFSRLPGSGSTEFALPFFDNSMRNLWWVDIEVEVTPFMDLTIVTRSETPNGRALGITLMDHSVQLPFDSVPTASLSTVFRNDCLSGSEPSCLPFRNQVRYFQPKEEFLASTKGANLFSGVDAIQGDAQYSIVTDWRPVTNTSFFGDVFLTGNAKLTFTYDAKTQNQYAWEIYDRAIADATSTSASTTARNAYEDTISAREGTFEGVQYNSSNLGLRNIEWFIRGFQGASLIFDPSDFGNPKGLNPNVVDKWNDFFNLIAPSSSQTVDLVKTVFGKDSLNDANAARASEAGGSIAAISGWKSAILGRSLEEAISLEFGPRLSDSGDTVLMPRSVAPGLASLGDAERSFPVEVSSETARMTAVSYEDLDLRLPVVSDTFVSPYFDGTIMQDTSLFFEPSLDADTIHYFGSTHREYLMIYSDEFIDTMWIRPVDETDETPGVYSMYVGESVFEIIAGDYVDVAQFLGGLGASSILLEVRSVDLLGQEFVVGLGFAGEGGRLVGIDAFDFPDSTVTPVPIPLSGAMLGSSLALLGVLSRIARRPRPRRVG